MTHISLFGEIFIETSQLEVIAILFVLDFVCFG
jgi:hypothetical protein